MYNILNLIEENRNNRKKALVIFIVLSFLVEIFTISFLVRPAYSIVNKAECGVVEHTHTSECYLEHNNYGESVLVCCSDSSLQMLSHIHDDFCYNEKGKIICPLLEYQHIHTDDCYDENGLQICGAAYHQHREECFHILGKNESALVLECGKASHVHAENCYPELFSTPLNNMQEDFNENQSSESEIDEFNFDNDDFFESEVEHYDLSANNGITLLDDGNNDVENSDGYVLNNNNIQSVTLEYKNENGTWVVVNEDMNNVPANADMRIEVKYQNVNRNDIVNKNNKIIYNGIPKWMNPDSTGNIYDQDGNVVATLIVVNGNATITFDQDYLANHSNATINGTFSVEGTVDWRQIGNSNDNITLPGLNFNFKFEDELSAKYGDFNVEKHNTELIEVRDEEGKISHTYLKYELKVTSLESNINIPNITITDILTAENRNLDNVIKGNGYVGVDGSTKMLCDSANDQNPYETVIGITNYNHGTAVLENNNLKWEIANLQPNEVRTLVYYVELNENYVGSGSAGILYNEAKPKSGDFERESVHDEFVPKADVDIHKAQNADDKDIDINEFGNGTIKYTITVTANSENSYTITDAYIKDSFGNDMADYVKKITLNTKDGKEITIENKGFIVPVPDLQPNASITITYYVHVENLFSKTNGDVILSNHASFIGGNKDGKIKKNYTFKGSGATTTIHHNKWMRKLNGMTVDKDTVILFGNNDKIYKYGDNNSQSDINGFTVPQNAQEYTVIVNEDGTWNMSGTNFHDKFSDDRIAYAGYLKIEEFDQTDTIPVKNNLDNETVLTNLNKQNPIKTVWINIDGKSSFDITPQFYGLTDEKKVYRLTYYAAVDSRQTNIKNITVANEFVITGDIGYGGNTLYLSGFKAAVSSTLIGSASYDFDKESLFYEKKCYTSGNGEIYWVIRANGTLPEGLHIQDRPSGNSMRSDSLVGVYLGDKGYDFSKITSYDELNTALSGMTELEGGTSQYFYELQSITDVSQLNGKDFAIFSRGVNISGYLTGIKNPNSNEKIKGERFVSQISFDNGAVTNEVVQTWHFERVDETDKFYIYYTDSLGNNHYLHVSSRSVTISNDREDPLTVYIGTENNANKIKIANTNDKKNYDNGEALNWYGGDNNNDLNYSGWNNNDGANNWHYLGTLDDSLKYNYKPQKINNLDELNGKQFAIITPGTDNSGLLVGRNSGTDALTGERYTIKFNDDPPTITRKSPLQKWTFEKKTNGSEDEFYIYYTDSSGQNHYLNLGNNSATTTTYSATIKISCNNNKIHLKTPDGKYALDWYGGGSASQSTNYSTWNNNDANNNQLHYASVEEIISSGSSNYAYSWSSANDRSSIKINKNTEIPQDKSMYIVLRTHPNKELSGDFPITFNNDVGIIDNVSGQFDKLDGAFYIYNPNLPLKKEGKVAVYYNAEETDTAKQWKICSVSPGDARGNGENVWTSRANGVFSNERTIIQANGSGLYVEWLMNVNWDGTLDGDIILTDHLDHKMEPVLVRKFNLGQGIISGKYKSPIYNTIPELEVDPDWKKFQTHEIPFYYNEKTGELKISVGNLQKSNMAHQVEVNLQLICRVTDPDVIFSGDVSTLTNKADLTRSDGTFIGEQIIPHEIKPTYSISKKGEGAKSNGLYVSNKLNYEIEINPQSEDLIVGGDTLPVLIDEMSSNMELIGNVEIYKDSVSEETKLNKINYSTVNNANNKQIIFDNLPDKTHLIIKYKTKVNVTQSQEQVDINNTAYWKGYSKPSAPQHSESFSYSLGGSVTANDHPIVVINKVDFYNNSITLGGAEFEIRKVDTNGTVDMNDSNTIKATTGNDGKITIQDTQLDYNTVYQLKEIKAPTDYALDDAPKYFMVVNEVHNYDINNNKQIYVDGNYVDIIIDYAADQGSTDLELTIYNQKAHIKVDKVFLNESDNEITDVKFFGTYRFGLYYNPNEKPVQILSITYSDAGISYALDDKETNEPEFTKARAGATNFIYELNERNEPILNDHNAYLNGYSFYVTYYGDSNDNKVVIAKKGTLKTITIKNKYHPIYMPSAGGIGLKNYYKITFFALMILMSLTAIVSRVRRRCK